MSEDQSHRVSVPARELLPRRIGQRNRKTAAGFMMALILVDSNAGGAAMLPSLAAPTPFR